MEENKNNAMEKVDNIVKKSGQKGPTEAAEKRAEKFSEKQRVIRLENERRIERAKTRAEKRERKKQEKLAKKRYKERVNAERKAARADNKENKEGNGSDNKWKIGTISLGIATLILSAILMINYILPSSSDVGMENAYRRAFYDAVEQVDSIDANLSKALITKDGEALQVYLVDTAVSSELCESDIQELPLQDESKYYTAKLINQIGDFSKYLNKKLICGEEVSEGDLSSLRGLYLANAELKNALQNMMSKMDNDFSFSQMADGGIGNVVTENFNTLQNLSVNFPELIYDGPFSDGSAGREVKGLSGEKIDKASAVREFKKIFADRDVKNVVCIGKNQTETPTFNVTGETDGDVLYAEITETGGKLLMFSFAGSCRSVNIDEESAIECGQKFLEETGFDEMTAVWVNLANNVYTINFAVDLNGVTVYSDLVKVRVCGETGKVIGLEATSYFTNHKERTVEQAGMTATKAKEKVSDAIEIEAERLCIVPVGRTHEKLCYEFSGQSDGTTYYVYIDASTGKQVEMFRVIESTEGKLLI